MFSPFSPCQNAGQLAGTEVSESKQQINEEEISNRGNDQHAGV
jgi:hypothetical protein